MIDFRKVPYSDDYTKQETDANTVGELFVLEAFLMMNHVPTSQMVVLNKFATTKTGETKKNIICTHYRVAQANREKQLLCGWSMMRTSMRLANLEGNLVSHLQRTIFLQLLHGAGAD